MARKRCYDTLIGASVGENQLCNGESVTVPNGRKYYLKKSGVESLGASAGTAITGLTSGSDMVIDLTQMLGSAIADYAYTLEQATAGSGIAWLRSYGFLKGYQAYNAGSIESVEVTEKKCVGFNQWDEVWEPGAINASNGANVSDSTRIRTKNYIRVLPDTNYFFCIKNYSGQVGTIVFYDADKNFVQAEYTPANTVLKTPKNVEFMKIGFYVNYGTSYNHDICINLSSDRNGEYEPYHSASYPLGSDTLRGIFKLDANNRLYADGDRKEADGTVTRKYGIVDLGTLNWVAYSSVYGFRAPLSDGIPVGGRTGIANAVCTNYPIVTNRDVATTEKSMAVGAYWASGCNVYVHDEAYTDATTFKTAMNGVYLVYELATPTTESASPFTNPQIVDPDGTEEYVTANGVPVGHETRYQL